MKLIENWKGAFRWFSVQFPALNLAFLGTWSALPSKFQDALPMPVVMGIAAVLIVLGVIGRLVDQTPPKDKP